MIEELSVQYSIKECCRALNVSRSGYYQWVGAEPSLRAKEEAKLLEQIVEVFEANKERYGSPRVTRELRQQGVGCGENRVARLMHENELAARRIAWKRDYKGCNGDYLWVRAFRMERANR